MEEHKSNLITLAVLALLCLSVPAAIWVVASHFEAATFTKMTGKPASTWDAMWVNLRVMGE